MKMEQNEMMKNSVTVATKKKIKPWQVVTALVAVGFSVLIAILIKEAVSMTGGGMPVEVAEVKRGSILQTIETSGSVESEERKTYFASVAAEISELPVQVGQSVKKGELLLAYDTDSLEKTLKQAELDAKITECGADSTLIGINTAEKKAADAVASYEEAEKYVAHYTDCVNKVNAQLQEFNSFTQEQSEITAEIEGLTKKLEKNPDNQKYQKALTKAEKELEKVNKDLKKYDVAALQGALEVCSGDLAEYKARLEQYKAEKDMADPAASVNRAQQAAVKESAQLTKTLAEEMLAEARKGITAEFDGIVSEVNAVEGQFTAEGVELFTIQNANLLKVRLSVSKYDMQSLKVGQKAVITINEKEYTGMVSNISRVAATNASGATAVDADIHIDNPDEAIVLGMEAKVSIEVAEEKDIILIPNACVNYSSEGIFCYVVLDGVIEKRDITTGISDDANMQVHSGLKEGEQVVTAVTEGIGEGVSVTAVAPAETESAEE